MFKTGMPKPPTSGRKKGTPNRKTAELQEVLVKHNFDAARELIYCYEQARAIFEVRKKRGNLSGALVALDSASGTAEKIAQYVYPKKRAVEHTGEVGVKNFADFIAAGLKGKK